MTCDTLLSQVDLSTGNIKHVILDTRPSYFSRAMLKSWEWPGDEATPDRIWVKWVTSLAWVDFAMESVDSYTWCVSIHYPKLSPTTSIFTSFNGLSEEDGHSWPLLIKVTVTIKWHEHWWNTFSMWADQRYEWRQVQLQVIGFNLKGSGSRHLYTFV